ncbi:uncharacterized protein LOC122504581 [Leptopilina heterotoma]|uniref:uncharacterized protein LOC122504581 n=1 Tax=Leptopilina heterotoma TaxID=63436 RepID=UPI001CA9D928|nr:uncharacterized protein LOC122504581 [Leptopilina heterotoma]
MHKTEMEVYGIKRTDEDDCKLSTVPELPEFSSPPSQTLKSNQDSEDYRNGSFTNSVTGSLENVDMEIIPSISEKVAARSSPVDYSFEDQIQQMSSSSPPTISKFSTQ